MNEKSTITSRLFEHWPYATLPMAFLLLGLYPFIGADEIIFPLYLSLICYLIHEYEEHENHRFPKFVQSVIGADKKGMSHSMIWVGNIFGVWFFHLGVFYLEPQLPGWGVLAAYLMMTNALLHIVWALIYRKTNPGIWSAIFLFVPASIWIWVTIPATMTMHIVSLVFTTVMQVGVFYVASRPKSA